MDRKPETPADPAAEKKAAADVLRRAEEKRLADAERKRRERKEKKKAPRAGRRPPTRREPAPGAPGQGTEPAPAVSGEEPAPLVQAAQAGRPAPAAPAPPPLCASAEELAGYLAKGDHYVAGFAAQLFGERAPRLASVLSSLQWADEKGAPSSTAIIAAHSMWPCIEKYGWHRLPELPPEILFAFGLLMLLGPVAIRAFDEARAAKAEQQKKPAAVVSIRKEEEQQEGAR